MEFIKDDKSQSKKYDYLNYTEFLEFIIRVALKIFQRSDLAMERKVHKMLEMMYTEAKILTSDEAYKVNDEVDISL